MISNELIVNIENFINRIGIVHTEQIMRMFAKTHSKDTVLWCIKQLAAECRINYDQKNELLWRRQILTEAYLEQKLIKRAAWGLTEMREEHVLDYWVVKYPFQLLIIGNDNTVYDVTIFTYNTVNSLILTYHRILSGLIPNGISDDTIHIAVVKDKQADTLKLFIPDNDNYDYKWSIDIITDKLGHGDNGIDCWLTMESARSEKLKKKLLYIS